MEGADSNILVGYSVTEVVDFKTPVVSDSETGTDLFKANEKTGTEYGR